MIHYTLVCDQRHEFDGWFRGSAGFEEQKRRGDLVCPDCGSTDVSKGIMAPNVATSSERSDSPPGLAEHAARRAQMHHFLTEMRARVEKTCDYVGGEFPDEARRIHQGDSEKRNIYGEATLEQARELHDEGIPVMPVPAAPNADN